MNPLHQTDICAKFLVKTPYGWGATGGKKKKKIMSKNNSLPRQLPGKTN
jgi:hypothetical protein